jgi:hypothetical protein
MPFMRGAQRVLELSLEIICLLKARQLCEQQLARLFLFVQIIIKDGRQQQLVGLM